jgi:hypothetical protein
MLPICVKCCSEIHEKQATREFLHKVNERKRTPCMRWYREILSFPVSSASFQHINECNLNSSCFCTERIALYTSALMQCRRWRRAQVSAPVSSGIVHTLFRSVRCSVSRPRVTIQHCSINSQVTHRGVKTGSLSTRLPHFTQSVTQAATDCPWIWRPHKQRFWNPGGNQYFLR